MGRMSHWLESNPLASYVNMGRPYTSMSLPIYQMESAAPFLQGHSSIDKSCYGGLRNASSLPM